MPQAKRRRDGTKRSHGEWASSHGFKWFSEDSIPDDWIDPSQRDTEEYRERNNKLKVKMT